MKSVLLVFALAMTALVGCAETPTTPSDATREMGKTVVSKTEGEYWIYNPCNGDWIYFSGKTVTNYGWNENSTLWRSHTNYPNWKGTGESGIEYVFPGATNGSFHFVGAGVYTTVDRQPLIATGKDGKTATYTIKITTHTTINANGEVTSEVFSFEIECGNGNTASPL